MNLFGESGPAGVSPTRVLVICVLITLTLLFLIGGLALRQIFEGPDYLRGYERQSLRYITVPAPRGDILDRNGNVIASSSPRCSVVIDLGTMRGEFAEETRRAVRAARRERQKFSGMEIDVAALRASAVTQVVQRHLDRVNKVLGRSRVLDPAVVARWRNDSRALPFPLAEKLTPEEKARFVEAFPPDAPEQLFIESARTYPHGKLAAHLLGKLTDDGGEFRDELPADSAGRRVVSREGKRGEFGIERRFDETIRGRDGYQLWRVDNLGYLHEKIEERKPERGAPFVSSIDLELQKAAEAALDSRSRAGAVIALDVRTGEILALASAPAFDPRKVVDGMSREYYRQLQVESALMNRAFEGRYPPGSTFKLVTAVAAMRAKTFNDSETIAKIAPGSAAANRPSGPISPAEKFSCGAFLIVNRQKKPEHDLVAFGEVDLARMIRVSSNVYCYNAALILGIEPIAEEAFRFGFGERVPVELPEATPRALVVPTPKYKRDVVGAGRWVAGDTTNASIGQGYNQISPLHIAAMTASLARRETRTRLSVVHDPARSRVSHGGEPLGVSDEAYAEILRGMIECVAYGTGKKAQVPGLEIAAKSGTAQWKIDRASGARVSLAWFTAFAPARDPKIAVTVVLEGMPGENIGGGSAAGPVAGAVLKRWKELSRDDLENAVPAADGAEDMLSPDSSLYLDEYLPND